MNPRVGVNVRRSVDKPLFRRELSKRFPIPMSPMSLGIKRIEESVEEGNRPSSQSRNGAQRSVRKKNRRDIVDVVEVENEEGVKRRRTSSDGRLRRGLNPRSGLNVRQIDTPLFRRELSKR